MLADSLSRRSTHARVRAGFSLVIAAFAVLLVSCAGTPRRNVLDAIDARSEARALAAYEVFRREEEPDGALLARVAALMLEQAALGDDAPLRDAALSQLVLAGTAGKPVLQVIGTSRGHDIARARALAALAQRGDGDAKESLRGLLGNAEPEVHAAAIRTLDAHSDLAALRDALGSPHAVVRAAAAEMLRSAAPNPEVRVALADVARVDPDPRVRAAAVRALASFGGEAVDVLRERLSDAEAMVRVAAVASLVSADRTAARLALTPLLAQALSQGGIDAARFLARGEGDDQRATVDARAYLLRALEASDANLRISAAVALLALPDDAELASTIARLMEHDTDAQVRLLLASMLAKGPVADSAARARAVLTTLLGGDGMPSVQAAATLASLGDRAAKQALHARLRDANAAIRRVAARALARDAMEPDAVRGALRDPDASVRIAAAGGVLAAEAAR